ncbi:MAG: glycosyltransferase family 25 protein [Pseudomonadota bacterium]
MQIYVINLDKKTDRWAIMTRQAKDLGLTFQRVSAVTPDSLSAVEIANWERLNDKKRISITEYACALSHKKVWQQASDDPTNHNALILEDDVVLSKKLPDVLSDIGSQADWEVLRLETYNKEFKVGRRKPLKTRHVGFYSLAAGDFGAAAYILSPKTARLLAKAPTRIDVPVDTWLFDRRCSDPPPVKIFQSAPALAVQRHRLHAIEHTIDETSSLESTRAFVHPYRNNNFMCPLPSPKIVRELSRPLFQVESLIYQYIRTPIGEPCEYSGGAFVEFLDNIE